MKPAILVVDDDTAVCELLQDVLNEHVFTVHVCHNGLDALALAQREPGIALVLLDMMLPDINGLQVLQQLQKQRAELPVIMLTGLGSESDVVVGLEMGADDYIGKPFNPRVVVARVKAVLRRTGVLAARDLRESDERVYDICLRYGFDSQQTFTRIFTRTFNQPPGAYRKENHSRTH